MTKRNKQLAAIVQESIADLTDATQGYIRTNQLKAVQELPREVLDQLALDKVWSRPDEPCVVRPVQTNWICSRLQG